MNTQGITSDHRNSQSQELWINLDWKRSLILWSPTTTYHFQVHHWAISQSTTSICLLNIFRVGKSSTSLGILFQRPTSISTNKCFLISNPNSSSTTWGCLCMSHKFSPEKRDYHSPHYNLNSGSWREKWGLSSASFPPGLTTPHFLSCSS